MASTGFDASYFPEIVEVREVESPLTSINQELRRKNVVAAASVSGPNMLHSPSDPWSPVFVDYSAVNDPLVDWSTKDLCTCLKRRGKNWAEKMFPMANSVERSNLASTAKASSTTSTKTTTRCASCGKYILNPRTLAWGYSKSDTTKADSKIDDPQHASALLQATPKLRHLSLASTDMQQMGRSRNLLSMIISPAGDGNEAHSSGSTLVDYKKSLARERANHQAASELASLLFSLFHEMSLEDYGMVESEVFTSVFALVHDTRKEYRMAGLAALDALVVVEAPSADEEKKGIKFANALSKALQSAHGDFEFLSAVSKALGHMALRTTATDFVDAEVARALEWLRTERSDRR
jgi:hypothetical protein